MAAERSAADRALILACSRRKRPDEELLPAVERYDGPAFRVLRRFLRDGSPEAPDIFIISAEHGLIPHDLPIAAYDRQMTPARARELRPTVLAELDRIASTRMPLETLVFAGRTYLVALDMEDGSSLSALNARVCVGSIGGKLSRLRDWLYGSPPAVRYNSGTPARGSGARIRGVEVALTPEQVLEAARDALAEGWGNPDRYETWYVPVDDRRVAPKWLVSRITSLPVGSFHSDDARHLLHRLGVEVRRA